MVASAPQETRTAGEGGDGSRGRSYRDPRLAWLSERRLFGRRIRNLQLAAMVLFVACLSLVALIAWMASQSRVVPYIVEVDQLGQAVAFAPAERLERLDDRLVTYQLSLWIHHLRTVSPDPDIQRRYLELAFGMTRDNASVRVKRYFEETNPFERARRQRVGTRVQSILPLGEALWQIQWTEAVTGVGGQRLEETHWQAVVAVELDPPRDTRSLLANPLGLFVTDIDWTETL